MSFVGDTYQHDIFVSYAHGDPNQAGTSPLKRWTQAFVNELRNEISATQPRFSTVDVFLDPDIDPTLPLTPQLRRRAEASAILLIVMTEYFLKSTWCNQEIEWFAGEMTRRRQEQGRFFIVRATETDEKNWPKHFKDEAGAVLPGFYFHPRAGTNRTEPYGWRIPTESADEHRPFFRELTSLAGRCRLRLDEMKARHERAARPANSPVSSAGNRLYLHARPQDVGPWQMVREILRAAGFKVFPDDLRSADGSIADMSQLRRRRLQQYRDCDAVLILQSDAGDWIDGEIDLIARSELGDVEAMFEKRLPCAVLDRTAATGRATRSGIDVLAAAGESWLPEIGDWLGTAGRGLVAAR